jgi:hypothetical protein
MQASQHLSAARMATVVDVLPTPLDVPAMTTVWGQAAPWPSATIRAQGSHMQPPCESACIQSAQALMHQCLQLSLGTAVVRVEQPLQIVSLGFPHLAHWAAGPMPACCRLGPLMSMCCGMLWPWTRDRRPRWHVTQPTHHQTG